MTTKINVFRNLWISDLGSKEHDSSSTQSTKYSYEICIFPDNSIIGTNTETKADSIISGPQKTLALNEVVMWLSAAMDATEYKQDKWILVYSLDATQAAAISATYLAMIRNTTAMDELRALQLTLNYPKSLTALLKDWDYRT